LLPSLSTCRDRLYEILDAKIKTWSVTYKQNRSGLFGSRANKLKLQELLVERLVVAYDLAAAFWYMHQNKCVEAFEYHCSIRNQPLPSLTPLFPVVSDWYIEI
jgi:hypothetical protein